MEKNNYIFKIGDKMGIKSLTTILSAKCKSAINRRNLDSYRGMILGIDISIFLYKFLYGNDDHLDGIVRILMRLLKNGILPVIIFDGRPPKEKSEVLTNRKEKRDTLVTKKEVIENFIQKKDEMTEEQMRENIEEYMKTRDENVRLDVEEIEELIKKDDGVLREELDKTVKRIIYVTSQHIESTKRLCKLMGVPYIVSKGEAETLMGHLCRDDIIDGCISEDTDVLVNGGKIFIRNLVPDKNNVEEYCLEGILNGLGMTYEQFIDMCILCGCDYTSKIGGMGPMTAYKMMKKHNDIVGVLEELRKSDKFKIPEDENFDYEKARHLFKHSTDNEDKTEIQNRIVLKTPQMEELMTLLGTTKLTEKHRQDVQTNLMIYMKNIKDIIPDNCTELIIPEDIINKKKKNTNVSTSVLTESSGTERKITDFFKKI